MQDYFDESQIGGSEDEDDIIDEDMINCFREMMEEDSDAIGILNPVKVLELARTAAKLMKVIKAENPQATVKWEYGQVDSSLGTITIEGKNVFVKDVRSIADALGAADNIDIYPLTNGKIRVSFGFYGMAQFFKPRNS